MTLDLNQTEFAPGHTVVRTGTLSPGATPGLVVDLCVVVRLPNDEVLSFTGAGLVPGYVPIAASVTPPPPAGRSCATPSPAVNWGANYLFQAGLTEAGTGTIVGLVAARPFSFAP